MTCTNAFLFIIHEHFFHGHKFLVGSSFARFEHLTECALADFGDFFIFAGFITIWEIIIFDIFVFVEHRLAAGCRCRCRSGIWSCCCCCWCGCGCWIGWRHLHWWSSRCIEVVMTRRLLHRWCCVHLFIATFVATSASHLFLFFFCYPPIISQLFSIQMVCFIASAVQITNYALNQQFYAQTMSVKKKPDIGWNNNYQFFWNLTVTDAISHIVYVLQYNNDRSFKLSLSLSLFIWRIRNVSMLLVVALHSHTPYRMSADGRLFLLLERIFLAEFQQYYKHEIIETMIMKI